MKSARGVSSMMPAPSPVRPSAARAPRCSIAATAVRARRTTSWVGLFVRSARKPTPQASCSSGYIESYTIVDPGPPVIRQTEYAGPARCDRRGIEDLAALVLSAMRDDHRTADVGTYFRRDGRLRGKIFLDQVTPRQRARV